MLADKFVFIILQHPVIKYMGPSMVILSPFLATLVSLFGNLLEHCPRITHLYAINLFGISEICDVFLVGENNFQYLKTKGL